MPSSDNGYRPSGDGYWALRLSRTEAVALITLEATFPTTENWQAREAELRRQIGELEQLVTLLELGRRARRRTT